VPFATPPTKKGPPVTGRTYSGPGAATGAVAQRRATIAPFLSAPKKQRVVLSITFSCQTTYYYFLNFRYGGFHEHDDPR
jgi:hypothetical protein